MLGVWMPETKGVPIERMGDLFDSPWYLRWCAKPKDVSELTPSEEGGVAFDEKRDGKQAESRNAAL